MTHADVIFIVSQIWFAAGFVAPEGPRRVFCGALAFVLLLAQLVCFAWGLS